jgi:putative endonuclease
MPCVYIIYSHKINTFYIGLTTDNFELRIEKHNNKFYENKFTSKGIPWERFLVIECLTISQAVKIEKHIKDMKSRKYFFSLKTYPEIINKLLEKYL